MNINTTDTTIIITWDPADRPGGCGPVFYYTLTATSLDDGSVSTQRPSQTRAEFSNLLSGTNYTISVAAVNRAGSGPSSTITVISNGRGMYIHKQC